MSVKNKKNIFNKRGFPKTSVFGKATLDLIGKSGILTLFPKPFSKLTEFWERLKQEVFLRNKFFSILKNYNPEKNYRRILLNLLRRPDKVYFIAVLLTVTGAITLFLRPLVFINPDEAEEIIISAVFPPGTLLESTAAVGMEISKDISKLPFVKSVYGRAGAEEEDIIRRADIDYRKEELILRCVLEKRVKPKEALAVISSIMKHYDIQYSLYFPKDKTEVLLGLSSQHTFVIKGKNREELAERVKTVQDRFSDTSIPVTFRPSGQRPELRLYPNRETAAFLSIPAAQIAETMYILNEGIIVTRLEIKGRSVNVRVLGQSGFEAPHRFAEQTSDPIQRLEQIPLRTGQGRIVSLGSLGRIERREAEASLARLDRSDVIYTDILSDKNPAAAKETAAQFSWFSSADESVFNRYRSSLLLFVILVLILLYMAMGVQFESFLLPLILMTTIPFSFAGAGAALLISGSMIDSGAVLGLTVLFGLVVNNSLILFEISSEKIDAGFSPAAAVHRGACERLYAILITMAITVFALLPLVLNPLGNSQKSMAAAMLGGVIVSTLLSLFAIPSVLIRYFKWKLNCDMVRGR